MSGPSPIRFALTEDEARIAASRVALRLALADGLMRRHAAPLAAFVVTLAFVAILGFTGLMSQRAAEIVILLSAAAFMIHRLMSRRLFWRARREAKAWADAVAAEGEIVARLDEDGLALAAPTLARSWKFRDALEYDDAGGMVYLWPKSGAPAFWPARAFAEGQAESWRAFARARLGAAPRRIEEDDD